MYVPAERHRIEGLNRLTRYQIEVAAENRIGEGESSPLMQQTLSAPPGAPPQPMVQSEPSAVTTNSIAIRWDPPADTGGIPLTGYRVYWLNTVTNAVESTRVAVLPRIYRIEDLYAGTLYQISVAAENNKGEGVSSEALNQKTAIVRPLAPVQLGFETVTTTSITVNWGEPVRDGGSAVTTYRVYWQIADSTSNEESTEVLTRNHIITGLLSNTYYKIEVTAINVIGEGARSTPLEVRTDVPVPGRRKT